MSGAPTFSLREVAFRAGVAVSSASRALSGHPDVSPAMRTRVLAAAEELGYEPNLLAASFRRGSTMTAGLVVGDVSSPLVARMVLGAERRLREAGYVPQLACSEGSGELEAVHVNTLRRRRVDGLVLSPAEESDPRSLAQLGRLDVPYVLIDQDPGGLPGASAVLCDHAAGIDRAAEHLHGLGHRRVALVCGSPPRRAGRERRRAFEGACAGLGMQAAVETGADAAQRVLARSPRPTAVIADEPRTLTGLVPAIRAAGLRIPADISLATCGDDPLLAIAEPPIAAVSHDAVRVGSEAAGLLLRRMAGEPPATIVVATRFDATASCGPA